MEPPSELELQTKLMDRITPATEFSSHSDKYSSSICDTIYSRDFANDHHMHSQYTSLFRNSNDFNDFHKLNTITTTNFDCNIGKTDDNIASIDLDHGYKHHKSNSYSSDDNPDGSNYNPDDSICNSTTDSEAETCQISNEKDDRHVQVLESLSKVTKYFSYPYAEKFQVAMDSAKSTLGQMFNSFWDENESDFCNNYSANMNHVRSSYKTSEELEREEQEKLNRERLLLSRITTHNSKNSKPPNMPSTSSASIFDLGISVTPSPNTPKFSPGTSVATLMKEAADQRKLSQHNLRARKEVDYRALNTGKSPTKRQPPAENLSQNDLLLQKESMAWDNTFDINRPSINPWNASQITNQRSKSR